MHANKTNLKETVLLNIITQPPLAEQNMQVKRSIREWHISHNATCLPLTPHPPPPPLLP